MPVARELPELCRRLETGHNVAHFAAARFAPMVAQESRRTSRLMVLQLAGLAKQGFPQAVLCRPFVAN